MTNETKAVYAQDAELIATLKEMSESLKQPHCGGRTAWARKCGIAAARIEQLEAALAEAQNAATQAPCTYDDADNRATGHNPRATHADTVEDRLRNDLVPAQPAVAAPDTELIAELKNYDWFCSTESRNKEGKLTGMSYYHWSTIPARAAARIEQLERDLDAANAAMRHEREGYECAIASGYAADAQRERAEKAEARYEYVRRLTPREFSDLYRRNINGEGSFDELVDADIDAAKTNANEP